MFLRSSVIFYIFLYGFCSYPSWFYTGVLKFYVDCLFYFITFHTVYILLRMFAPPSMIEKYTPKYTRSIPQMSQTVAQMSNGPRPVEKTGPQKSRKGRPEGSLSVFEFYGFCFDLIDVVWIWLILFGFDGFSLDLIDFVWIWWIVFGFDWFCLDLIDLV